MSPQHEPSGDPGSFLIVSQYYPPERGAAQVRIEALARELARRSASVEVVTGLPNYPLGRIFDGWSKRPVQVAKEGSVRVIRVWVYASMGSGLLRMANYLSFGLMSLLGLARARRAGWTVIEYPTLFGALPAAIWCRVSHRRWVVLVADLWVDAIVEIGVLREGLLVRQLRKVERWLMTRATAVTAVTEGVRDVLIEKGVDPGRIDLLPNGADEEEFSPGPVDPAVDAQLGLEAEEHLILYAGTQGYAHGLEPVLDAAELLRDRPVRFVFIGSGSERPMLQARADELKLRQVSFHDPVPPADIARYLRRATAGLASVRESDLFASVRSAKMFPVMATAKPVLHVGRCEGSDMVAAIGAGIVVPYGDPEALVEAIEELIRDPGAAFAMGAAGRRWIETKGSWRIVIGQWLDDLGSRLEG